MGRAGLATYSCFLFVFLFQFGFGLGFWFKFEFEVEVELKIELDFWQRKANIISKRTEQKEASQQN